MGGGAVFFSLEKPRATLNDLNEKLVSCYGAVKDDPDSVSAILAGLPNSENDYYRIRDWRPRGRYAPAAQLIYLCSLSFNGIYRENLDGEYNVPYGYKTDLELPDKAQLRATALQLSRTRLVCGDFQRATALAQPRDLIYFDPPYAVAQKNGFLKYNSKVFSWADQVRLAREARRLADLGAYVIVSNADHPSIAELYASFRRHRLSRVSQIAAKSEARVRITECLYVSQNIEGP